MQLDNITVLNQTGNVVLVMGELVQEQPNTSLAAMFVEDQEFVDRVLAEGFDTSGSEESNQTNWDLVNSWEQSKKVEFLQFFTGKMSNEQLSEVFDRLFFGNKKN